MSTGWHRVLGFALTGEELDLPDHDTPQPAVLLAELAGLGWSGDRLREAARRNHQPTQQMRAGLGAAQYAAAMAEVRRLLGATGAVSRVSSGRTGLDAADRRLLADRPPHWG